MTESYGSYGILQNHTERKHETGKYINFKRDNINFVLVMNSLRNRTESNGVLQSPPYGMFWNLIIFMLL